MDAMVMELSAYRDGGIVVAVAVAAMVVVIVQW